MTCYDGGFGNLADGRHPTWRNGFGAGGGQQLLFYYDGDHNWYLGEMAGGQLAWTFAGNTAGFGNLNDGRPIYTGYFSNITRAEVLFYSTVDHNWYLGTFSGAELVWSFVGNTAGFGPLAEGHHRVWIGDFNADGRDDILFYYEGDHNWWLGSIVAGQLQWRWVGNTAGFGNLNEGRPFWTGYFGGVFRADIMFYSPGDSAWWLGTLAGAQLSWSAVGNTSGFGNLADGRPLWTGNFKTWYGGTEVLFYYPGDQNWWLGSVINGALTWNFAGNTTGFGQVWDGRPFYVGDFTGGGQADVLFHHPGDSTWWLGTISGTQLTWSLAGNTAGFGNLQGGHVFYTGDFNADGRADVLFYYPADGNWWLGSLVGGSLQWSLVGNTGTPLPHTSRVRVHIKTVAPATTAFLNNQIAGMREVFDTAGVFVDVAPIEDLSGDPALNHLWDIDVGGCPNWWPASHTSPDQNELYAHRNGVGENEIAIYIVRSVVASGDSATVGTIGCASHPAAWPSCVLERGGFSRWVMAHEVGHVLGLGHRSDTTDNLMFPSDDFTNTPPDLAADEATKMDQSHFTFTC